MCAGAHQWKSPEWQERIPREHSQHLPPGGAGHVWRHGWGRAGARYRDVRVAAHLHLLVRRHHHTPLLFVCLL